MLAMSAADFGGSARAISEGFSVYPFSISTGERIERGIRPLGYLTARSTPTPRGRVARLAAASAGPAHKNFRI